MTQAKCAWCASSDALPYDRYAGCCSMHCRDAMDARDEECEAVVKYLRRMHGVHDPHAIAEAIMHGVHR